MKLCPSCKVGEMLESKACQTTTKGEDKFITEPRVFWACPACPYFFCDPPYPIKETVEKT